jgi:hypothetical protein
MIKPAATSHTVRTLCFRYSDACLLGESGSVGAQSIVWLDKAAVEGDIAMKLNITEPSVQAYIAGGYQAERTEPLCCSSDGNVSFAQSAERPGSRTVFA